MQTCHVVCRFALCDDSAPTLHMDGQTDVIRVACIACCAEICDIIDTAVGGLRCN